MIVLSESHSAVCQYSVIMHVYGHEGGGGWGAEVGVFRKAGWFGVSRLLHCPSLPTQQSDVTQCWMTIGKHQCQVNMQKTRHSSLIDC